MWCYRGWCSSKTPLEVGEVRTREQYVEIGKIFDGNEVTGTLVVLQVTTVASRRIFVEKWTGCKTTSIFFVNWSSFTPKGLFKELSHMLHEGDHEISVLKL